MEVSFYLKRPDSTKPTAIFCRICYVGHQMKYYLPDSILPKFWNKANHRAKETTKYPEYPEFNRRLDNIASDVKTTIRKYVNDNEGEHPTPTVLKPLLDIAIRKGGKVEKLTFVGYFKQHLANCISGEVTHIKTGKPLTIATIKSYQTTLFNIERYIEDSHRKLDFENIDLDFYTSFNEYLATKHNQSLNTIGKYIKTIKSILNAATEDGVNKNLAYKSRKFITVTEEADTIYLTESELKDLANLNLKDKPRLDCIRDLFLVGCYTGLRFSDLSTLSPKQITGNMITLTQIKTGKPVVIPVHDYVIEILAKYKGKLPEPKSNQKTNEYIKEVCKEVKVLETLVSITGTKGGEKKTDTIPKHDLVSTHTARRSFATNEYLAGTPSLTIMAITGHRTEKSFLKYIRVTPDEHAKILQDIWADRKEKQLKKESELNNVS